MPSRFVDFLLHMASVIRVGGLSAGNNELSIDNTPQSLYLMPLSELGQQEDGIQKVSSKPTYVCSIIYSPVYIQLLCNRPLCDLQFPT